MKKLYFDDNDMSILSEENEDLQQAYNNDEYQENDEGDGFQFFQFNLSSLPIY